MRNLTLDEGMKILNVLDRLVTAVTDLNNEYEDRGRPLASWEISDLERGVTELRESLTNA